MTDDAPVLGLDPNTLWQYSQAFTAVSALFARVRNQVRDSRERDGRLAHSESEHAARLHEARQHPPIRLMNDDEQRGWLRRVPSDLAAQPLDEPFSVWTARLLDAQGKPTDEWGLEAHTRSQGTTTSSLFLVCRDAEDALAMTQYLREYGTSEHLGRLHELARHGNGQFVHAPAIAKQQGTNWAIRPAPSLVLSEGDWEAALRRELPPTIADVIIVKDPAHPHHAAWRELHELANAEIVRVGAEPRALAWIVGAIPDWNREHNKAPALAHWAITETRKSPDYERLVNPKFVAGPATEAVTGASQSERLRVTEVRSPQQAMAWAKGLDGDNPEHRIEAKRGFGLWGSEVDAILSRKFRGLVQQTNTVVNKHRNRHAGNGSADARVAAAGGSPESFTDSTGLQMLAAEVDQLDPAKRGDRRVAHLWWGQHPEIDRLIAEKFAGDPLIMEKVQIKYPDGLPEADAAVWRNRAQGDEAIAAVESAMPDDPRTRPREDIDAEADSRNERGRAAAQRGIAATVAGQQPEVVRRIVTQPAPGGTVRRT